MTIIAGVMSLNGKEAHALNMRDEILKFISRCPDNDVAEFGNGSCLLAKVDVGAFGAPAAYQDAAGNVSLLAGEPLLRKAGSSNPDRAADLRQLHAQWINSDWSGIRQCAGTFCAVHYNPRLGALTLIADKVGVRPLYYWVGAQTVVFSTALRILEQLSSLPLDVDIRGVTEIAVFGFPLGERTAYSGISTIGAGQTVQISRSGVQKSDYWRWDELPPREEDLSEVSQETYRRFHVAIRRRTRGNTAVAFMTGGLDSRSIVGTLVGQGVAVHTINYALEGTQDRVFGNELARALGTRHHQLEPDLQSMYAFRGLLWNQGNVSKWFDSTAEVRSLPRQIWSGDGGSVGLGHVYLNQEIVQTARSGRKDDAIDMFMRYNRQGVPVRLLQPKMMKTIAELPRQGVREELARLRCSDPGRDFHLFLMLNDQRRHLANLYENSDIDKLELQLPFFDADFLEVILGNPIDGFLRHEFYMKWLDNFSPSVLSVPWQSYPGHVACSLPVQLGLRYQWRDLFPQQVLTQLKNDLVSEIAIHLRSPQFPETIINRRRLRLTNLLTRLGVRNYDYLLKAAAVYCRYSAGGGRVPGAGDSGRRFQPMKKAKIA